MNNSGAQRIIPIILVIIIVIVAVAALISVGRSLFGGPTEPVVNTGKEALLNTSLDRSVRMTVRGPIVGDDVFHTYSITVSPTTRNLTTYQGYLQNQLATRDLSNNSKAYEQFVYALNRANMMEGKEPEGDANDTRGVCATGRLFRYDVMQSSNVVQSLWTTNCSRSKGSLKAVNQQLVNLFNAQIPNYTQLTSPISL